MQTAPRHLYVMYKYSISVSLVNIWSDRRSRIEGLSSDIIDEHHGKILTGCNFTHFLRCYFAVSISGHGKCGQPDPVSNIVKAVPLPNGLHSKRLTKILRKITTFLMTDMFRQSYCHRQCNSLDIHK